MSDQSFHEIQLSGKQLIFLFMCAVVITVVVFLFGVSVGRGVPARTAETAEAAALPSIEPVPAAPEPTQAAPNELSYADALEGEDRSKAAPPAPIAEEPAAEVPKSEAARKTEAAPPPAAVTPAAPPVLPAVKEAPKAAASLSGWVVQVSAFNANDVASREAAKLQSKGYPAFVFTEPPASPRPHYKVRVGPYPRRADADSMLKTLTKEGYTPLLKR
jgi:cell division septation protein DedD